MMNRDGSYITFTPREFAKRLAWFTPAEQVFILRMRRELGIDKEIK